MTTNADAVRTGAGMLGGVWDAPKGTTAPTDPTTAYAAGWLELGIIDESGIVESANIDTTVVKGRDGSTVRVIKHGETVTFKFICEETNGEVSDRFYEGSSRVTAAGVTTRQRKTRQPERRAWAFDFLDGDIHTRTIIPDGEVSDVDDVTYQNSDITKYGFTITAYPDADGVYALDYTDDPNLAAA